MVYAICSQVTSAVAKKVLGDADTVQVVKDCRNSLTEAQRLPIDTLVLDVQTIRSADEVLTYKTTVRQSPRIVLLATQATPGDKTIGHLVSYGVYDIVTDLNRLADVLASPPATIVQAARWIVRDHKKDRGGFKARSTGSGKARQLAGCIGGAVRSVGTSTNKVLRRVGAKVFVRRPSSKSTVSIIDASRSEAAIEPFVYSEINERCSSNDNEARNFQVQTVVQPIRNALSDETDPMISLPTFGTGKEIFTSYRRSVGAIANESRVLAGALIILAWRVLILSIQLLPYALAAELLVLLGYVPQWAEYPALGYWSIARAIDSHVPTFNAMWHYVAHLSTIVAQQGRGA